MCVSSILQVFNISKFGHNILGLRVQLRLLVIGEQIACAMYWSTFHSHHAPVEEHYMVHCGMSLKTSFGLLSPLGKKCVVVLPSSQIIFYFGVGRSVRIIFYFFDQWDAAFGTSTIDL